MSVQFSTHGSRPRLVRTKVGTADDTVYASGATVPPNDECGTFPSKGPRGKGGVTHVELEVVAVDADGVVQPRAGTFTLRMTQVVSREAEARSRADGSAWEPVAVDAQPLTGQGFQSLIRVPCNGGIVFFGLESIDSPPAGATNFQIWARPVAG